MAMSTWTVYPTLKPQTAYSSTQISHRTLKCEADAPALGEHWLVLKTQALPLCLVSIKNCQDPSPTKAS